MTPEMLESGKKLLAALDRIIDKPEDVIAKVAVLKRESGPGLDALCDRIVAHYGNRSALAGGITAAPALIPGFGAILAMLGGALADVALLLKFQIEMSMALSSAYGYDVRLPQERQIAFLLAAVNMHKAVKGTNLLKELGDLSRSSIWSYDPKDLSAVLLRVFGLIGVVYAATYAARSVFKILPIIGIGVGATMNKKVTSAVGNGAREDLAMRKKLGG